MNERMTTENKRNLRSSNTCPVPELANTPTLLCEAVPHGAQHSYDSRNLCQLQIQFLHKKHLRHVNIDTTGNLHIR